MKNYYEILEVNPKASREIIEKAYKVLAKKYHPDMYTGEKRDYAEQKIRDVNEAYKILSDEFLREQYDSELEKEAMYNNPYNNLQNSYSQNVRKQNQTELQNEEKPHKVGTFMSLVDVTKEVFKNVPKMREKKELQKDDIKAALITAIIVIVLGIALWFIPVTHGFIRSLIPF